MVWLCGGPTPILVSPGGGCYSDGLAKLKIDVWGFLMLRWWCGVATMSRRRVCMLDGQLRGFFGNWVLYFMLTWRLSM